MRVRSDVGAGVAALASIVAILIAAVACSPPSSRSEPPSPPVASTTILPTTGTATTPIVAADGSSATCRDAGNAFATLGPRVLMTYGPGGAPAQDAALDADVARFRALVPDEVKPDADTYVRTLLAFVATVYRGTAQEGHGSTVQDRAALDDANQLLQDPAYVAATARLEHYFRETCGVP
jgi:hypothetical protein